ncbi:TraV family lipoprotein [Desulfoprunum benzoelyticum]|uniref:Conjugal transfer pilus assembly protein TraV n=1 Tax=Desulfoprunum benzoelyticum TaxID=1506996 RepID=A0A840UUE3_9BACT|nr:conjugal transfer pilus assembly protein TraV [Desulfoprunum benzoelyticum]MBM9528729.1 TraV family lipoprotein [Desulfoprunum benzoelyticum]
MNNLNQILGHLFLLFMLLLAGCGPVLNPYNEDFKCRAKDDAGECIDTPTAYQKARHPETEIEVVPTLTENAQQEVQDNRYRIVAELLKEETKPLLQPPKILRVLLLPYKGEDEELFMSRYVYLKIEDSQWVLTDLEEQ